MCNKYRNDKTSAISSKGRNREENEKEEKKEREKVKTLKSEKKCILTEEYTDMVALRVA